MAADHSCGDLGLRPLRTDALAGYWRPLLRLQAYLLDRLREERSGRQADSLHYEHVARLRPDCVHGVLCHVVRLNEKSFT